MSLNINIATGSSTPIYKQITDQVHLAVATGKLSVDEQLPSVRALAEQLVLNPNTVARAYAELEHAGIVTKRHGSGTYVSDNGSPLKRAERLKILSQRADALVAEARHLEVEISELLDVVRERHRAMQSKE